MVCVPPGLLQDALATPSIGPSAALLRADLAHDRALTALAARRLMAAGLAVAVAKRPLPRVAARRALFGAFTAPAPALPPQLLRLLLPAGPPGAVA